MKILIFANNDVGLYQFRRDLIYELLKNHTVHIALPYGKQVDPLIEAGCKFIDVKMDRRGINPVSDYSLLLSYRRILSEVKPDLVITYTIKPNVYGGYAARRKKITYAVNITGLGTAFENKGILRFIAKTLYKVSAKKAKVVFFENSSDRDLFVNEKIIRKEQACLLNGAGVDTGLYCYTEYPHNEICRFLFVGRIMKEKGIGELISAAKGLVTEGRSLFLDVVGPYEDDYEELLSKCEKEGWLKNNGFQEDVKPFIRNSDCFVLPSYHEGMANTNLESASSGRPVITSDIPGCKEAVINGISGFLCKTKDVESLKDAMRKVLDLSYEERRALGIAGRKHMEAVFEKKKVVKETIEALFK